MTSARIAHEPTHGVCRDGDCARAPHCIESRCELYMAADWERARQEFKHSELRRAQTLMGEMAQLPEAGDTHDPWCQSTFMFPEGPCDCGGVPADRRLIFWAGYRRGIRARPLLLVCLALGSGVVGYVVGRTA